MKVSLVRYRVGVALVLGVVLSLLSAGTGFAATAPQPTETGFAAAAELVRPGKSGGCYVCEPPLSLPDASAL